MADTILIFQYGFKIKYKNWKTECVLQYKIQALYSYKIDGDIVWLVCRKKV